MDPKVVDIKKLKDAKSVKPEMSASEANRISILCAQKIKQTKACLKKCEQILNKLYEGDRDETLTKEQLSWLVKRVHKYAEKHFQAKMEMDRLFNECQAWLGKNLRNSQLSEYQGCMVRNPLCPKYRTCLCIAAQESWSTFTCAGCEFENIKEDITLYNFEVINTRFIDHT